MFQTIIQKIIFAITMVLCLGLISCGETNQPIPSINDEPIVINIYDNVSVLNYPVFNNPVVTIDDEGKFFFGPHFVYGVYDVIKGNYGGALIHYAVMWSDLIVVTEVYKVNTSKNSHTAYLTITETLRGSTNNTEIKVNTSRFSKNEKYIFFLFKVGDRYFPISDNYNRWCYTAGIVSLGPWAEFWQDDIKSIISAYNNNKELFPSKQTLFQLYPQLNNWLVKFEVLIDIRLGKLDKQDIPVLLEWKQMETDDMGVVSTLLDHIIHSIEKGEE
jgi:hypothetical protein